MKKDDLEPTLKEIISEMRLPYWFEKCFGEKRIRELYKFRKGKYVFTEEDIIKAFEYGKLFRD